MLITPTAVANILGISRATVLRRVEAGMLPEPIRDGPGRYRKWDYDEIVKLRDGLHPPHTPPASCVTATPSGCEPPSQPSSGRPGN